MSHQIFVLVGIVLTLSWSLVSCSLTKVNEPASAAKEWMIAVTTRDALAADGLTCKTQRKTFREDLSREALFFGAFEYSVGQTEVELDLSEVEFKTIEQLDDGAIVKASGEMRAAAGNNVDSEALDETWFMVLEDDEWRWCGNTEAVVQNDKEESNSSNQAQADSLKQSEGPSPLELATLAIKTVRSFRSVTTGTIEGESLAYESVFSSPNEYHTTWRLGGKSVDVVQANGKNCVSANDTGWQCSDETSEREFRDIIDIWNSILEGDNYSAIPLDVVDHGHQEGTIEGEPCHIFHTQTAKADGSYSENTKLCIDPSTFHPVILTSKVTRIINGEDVTTLTQTRFYDINELLEVTLP